MAEIKAIQKSAGRPTEGSASKCGSFLYNKARPNVTLVSFGDVLLIRFDILCRLII